MSLGDRRSVSRIPAHAGDGLGWGDERPDQPAVRCTGLRRRYGEGAAAVDALAGVDLEFPRGQLTSIVGPSGSGKSTLMHCLAGLDRPTAGEVWVDGVEITGLDDGEMTQLRRDKLGFVFQFFNLVPSSTPRRTSPCRRGSPARTSTPPGSRRCSRRLGSPTAATTARPSSPAASSSASRSPGRWSRSRPVVFADEPTGNLDSSSSTQVLELLRRSVDELGRTVIMVTHDPRVAAYADRVVLLVDGSVASDTVVESSEQVLELMQTA